MSMDSVCYKCEDRHVGCHQDCKRYNDAKEAYEKEKKAIRGLKATDKSFMTYETERVRKALRRKNVH